jgi:hypothetical protein
MTAKKRAAIALLVLSIVACNAVIIITLRILLEKTNEKGEPLLKEESREFVYGFLGVFVMTFCFCCCGCFCCGGRVCGIRDSHELLYVKNWRRKKVNRVVVVSPEKMARWNSPRPSIIESGQTSPGYYSFVDYETKVTPDIMNEKLLAKLHK